MDYDTMARHIDKYIGERANLVEAMDDVLDALEDAIYITAQHIETDWQDEMGAKYVRSFGRDIGNFRIKLKKWKKPY